jgi:hypothetical protein
MSLIAHCCHVLKVIFYTLCNSPAIEFYVPTFRNNLLAPPMKLERTVSSVTSVRKIQTRGNHPKKEYIIKIRLQISKLLLEWQLGKLAIERSFLISINCCNC